MCHTDCTAQTHFLNVLKSVLSEPVLQICGSKVQKWAKVRRFYGIPTPKSRRFYKMFGLYFLISRRTGLDARSHFGLATSFYMPKGWEFHIEIWTAELMGTQTVPCAFDFAVFECIYHSSVNFCMV